MVEELIDRTLGVTLKLEITIFDMLWKRSLPRSDTEPIGDNL